MADTRAGTKQNLMIQEESEQPVRTSEFNISFEDDEGPLRPRPSKIQEQHIFKSRTLDFAGTSLKDHEEIISDLHSEQMTPTQTRQQAGMLDESIETLKFPNRGVDDFISPDKVK